MAKITVPEGNTNNGGGQLLPDGTYRCLVAKINVGQTRSGAESWRVRLGVVDGPHFGRTLYDSIHFSEKAMPRTIRFSEAIGLKVSGTTEVTPEMCQGRECLVTIHSESYRDREDKERERNVVDFDGYAPTPDATGFTPPATSTDDDDDLPF